MSRHGSARPRTSVEVQAKSLLCAGNVQDIANSARSSSPAVIRRAIQLEEKAAHPSVSRIRVLKTELRRKEREAAAAPKDAA